MCIYMCTKATCKHHHTAVDLHAMPFHMHASTCCNIMHQLQQRLQIEDKNHALQVQMVRLWQLIEELLTSAKHVAECQDYCIKG